MSKHKTIKKGIKFSLTGMVAILFLSVVWVSTARVNSNYHFDPYEGFSGVPINPTIAVGDSPAPKPSGPLHYPFDDNSYGDPEDQIPNNTLYLSNPSNLKTNYVYNPDSNNFTVTQKVGDLDYRPPMDMSLEEYAHQDFDKQLKNYWKQRTHAENLNTQKKKGLVPKLYINNEYFDRIFGGNTVDIRPNGSAELIFAGNVSKTDNPSLPVKQRRISTFDFNEKIQLNVIGKIGDKLKLTTNYNTEAAFEFENQMKLEYTGYEDDIIKKIEAGNVSLPLTGTLITGSQSLFGIKTQLQFGRTTVTSVLSQQKGKKSEIEVKGGAQTNNFEIKGDNYEANKHYFLAQYFRDHYDAALANLPVVVSGINITKVEVWVTNNVSSTGETRNIVALTDLGEENGNISNTSWVTPTGNGLTPGVNPDNANNSENPTTFIPTITNPFDPRSISQVSGALTTIAHLSLQQDFETIALAKKLSASEYTVNSRLGYISLNSQLNPDQVLAVAFQYTNNGHVFQVGEFSTDGISAPQCLYAKMLKSTNVSTRRDSLLWDLMMKNVYSIGAYQLRPDNFKLEVLYNNPATGTYVNTLPESTIPISGEALIRVMGLDHINTQMSGGPDGVFDFIDGVTINSQNGRVYFPVKEPFGKHLNDEILGSPQNINNQVIANKYAFQQLYDSTKTAAQQFPEKNRFIMRGSYTSASGSDISLNAANIPTGSVTVTAGGIPLTENVDYTVDYALGRVKIINEGILQSGTPIKISLESNSLFSIQSKTMMATRVDYRISKDFSLGSTVMRLSEKPLTQKVNIGDEPIKNTVLGFDGNYRTEAPWLTRLIDKLPLLSTKEMSTITSSFEVAKLFPGHAKAIGKTGTAYIDDFEGSQTTIDIKNVGAWTLASVPQNNPLFPEASQNGTASGFNRAKLCWYVIDPIFLRADNNLPSNIQPSDQSNDLVREILQTELFPNKQSPSGQPINIPTLDLAYYPSEIGPYNYDTTATPLVSAGVGANGTLNQPQTRWGGIMRKIETNDFEAANVQFIQFWIMDPYVRDANGNSGDYTALLGNNLPIGDLYFNIGDISEDILKDGKKSFENGLPNPDNPNLPYDITPWGRVPQTQSIVNAFANGSNADADRTAQDVGLDGLIDGDERTYFTTYLNKLAAAYGSNSTVYQRAYTDPSHDYYHYYRGTDYDANDVSILDRYKEFNGMEGNSPVSTNGPYPTSATTIPNTEDVNRDNNLSLNESYYQYKVRINPIDITPTNVGNNYITNVYEASTKAIDGSQKVVNWYQFKIPVKEFLPQDKIGNIEDFKSIRFMRVFLKGFTAPIVIRFAKLDLVRGEWRKYAFDLTQPGEYVPVDNTVGTTFDISAVNYEENGSKSPVNYVLPPAITQEVDVQTANLVKLNEQALSLKVCGLRDGDSRACYKNVDLDVRSYKKLKMFIHGESFPGTDALRDGDLTVFVRLGTDYTDNYYEYEIPLIITSPGNYNNNTDDDRRKVWRIENDMDLVFADLQRAKQGRNDLLAAHAQGYSLTSEYVAVITDENGEQRTIRIKGNPNLSTIKTIMIGIRNPKKTVSTLGDDGRDKCAEVWVNELRLTDFNEQGGWAATSRVTAKLADFGTLSLSGNISTPGWGSIDKKVSERKKETDLQYDVSTQLELGKFIPKKYNIHIPMFIGFSEARINPQYNPQDPDIELTSLFHSPVLTQAYKDSIKRETQDYTRRKSINFTNVKKDKGKGQTKNHIYDIENFSLNASYTELFNHSFTVKNYLVKDYRGGLSYNYSAQPKNIKPFAKMKIFSPKSLTLIRDFNFYPYPNKLSFVTDMDRHYSQRLIRNTTGDESLNIDTTYEKHWNWLRGYDMSYDIAKSLKLVYSADNTGQIREPNGKIDTKTKSDSVKEQIYALGTNTRYNQKVKIDWTVPINKFPGLDWITATASYTSNFDWIRSSFLADTMGNTLQNSGMKQLNGQMNMTTLYNKVPYLKKLNQRLAKKVSQSGKDVPPEKTPLTSVKNDPKADTTKKKKKDDNQYEILDYIARTVIMLKNVSLTYSNNGGMIIPGYLGKTEVLGLNPSAAYTGSGFAAPGAGFVFGEQRDPRDQLVKDGFLTKAAYNTPFTATNIQNISGRANIEPLPDFKIEVTANRNQSKTFNEYFKYDNLSDEFQHLTPAENGTFSMSYNMLKTAFEKQGKDFSSDVYTKFLNGRSTISTRLHDDNQNNSTSLLSSGFWNGYGATQQDVLMFSFLSAYSGSSENHYSLNPFPAIPKPNWRVTYDGLIKVPVIKKHFKTFTLSHMYRSSMSYSYTTNLNYGSSNGGASAFNSNGDLIVQKQISAVSLTEQFAPLIKVDMAMQNRITGNVEIKKDRNVGLSFANSQVTEINGHEYIIGAGYRIPNFTFKLKKKGKAFKSDLVLKTDLSIRKNVTVIRKVVENVIQPTAGQTVVSIKVSADYVLSERLNIRLFYDQVITHPAVSTSFNTSNINSGISIRFTLSQ